MDNNDVKDTVKDMSIAAFSTAMNGLKSEVVDLSILNVRDFNLLNYNVMLLQTGRNIPYNDYLLGFSGMNAYAYGNPENHSEMPQMPSYTAGINYLEYSDHIPSSERSGLMTTYQDKYEVNENLFNRTHFYWDAEPGASLNDDNQYEESYGFRTDGFPSSRNSILNKTRDLMRQGKIKSIVSKFHTDSDVFYNGQVRTENFGESHGRNLLTKSAEVNGTTYNVNGYENPYCRVWTHHYQYDRLYKTMRSMKKGINEWLHYGYNDEFEWSDEEKKVLFPYLVEQEDGENYAYAWRGYRNQSRREKYSVLDTDSGLVNMTPKFLGGGELNIHTKDCMFSIENLAWKDYDPYSFTQALSWEQRGPLGGRIMWFPPYDLSFTETSTANWNSNDFIGRGEKVYTYVNTERSGTLSFMMVTDHPSSIDYSSWWDNDEDKDNDYLRYFAGCMGGEFAGGGNLDGQDHMKYMFSEDNIHEKPPYLTDEYIEEPIPDIEADGEAPKPPEPTSPKPEDTNEDKTPKTVEFFVFYPNNYSGIDDAPSNPNSSVNAIGYLLSGKNAQKVSTSTTEYSDIPIDGNCMGENNGIYPGVGYEMGGNGVTTQDCVANKEYIIGGVSNKSTYVPDTNKKWCYRIDHILNSEGKYTGGEGGGKNTITQKLVSAANYKDTSNNGLNRDVSNRNELKGIRASEENELYSFMEVACAFYKTKGDAGSMTAYDYLYNNMEQGSKERVDKIVDVFTNYELKEVKCDGISNFHGQQYSQGNTRNTALAKNRASNIMAWLHTYDKWESIGNSSENDGIASVAHETSTNAQNVSDKEAKLYRSARCVMTFSTIEKKPESVTDKETKPDGEGGEVPAESGHNVKELVGFTPITNENEISSIKSMYSNITWDDKKTYTFYKRNNDNVALDSEESNITEDDARQAINKCGNIWVMENDSGTLKLLCELENAVPLVSYTDNVSGFYGISESSMRNKLRYDQEYYFYRKYFADHPFVFQKLQEKIRYFNPVFHSMTPEGFNARLTFLNQCTRQGMTKTMGDFGGKTANNLAFGRPPYCVLRIGDFYNQMIVIESVNFDYSVSDGIVWDLNTEGNGVQPMLCKVNITFKFIGGGDIAGPVRRLQNAMTFNYYANTSFYDNRADRVEYDGNVKTMGGAGNDKMNQDKSYSYIPKLYKDSLYKAKLK